MEMEHDTHQLVGYIKSLFILMHDIHSDLNYFSEEM
jgi:hypothetical protein